MRDPNKTPTVRYAGKFMQLMEKDTWEYVERTNCNGAVSILAYTPENKVLLIEQFRMATGKKVIEFPAGLVSDNGNEEPVEQAALRELEEETGYTAEKITWLTTSPTSAGLTSEMITFVLAEGLTKISAGGGVENENITIHEIPKEDVVSWLKQKEQKGLLVDIKVYAGLYFLM